ADPPLPRIRRHRRWPGGRGHPAQVRALRLLHGDLPHLPGAGRRTRRAARPHLPDQAGARRRAADRADAAAPGPLPHLPQLREHLPQRRAVRAPGGHRAPHRRREGCAWRRLQGLALGAEGRPDVAGLRSRDEARAIGARRAPRHAEGQGAGRAPRRALAHAQPRSQGADAGRLRPAFDGAQHQRRHRARARCGGDRDAGGEGSGLLRRGEVPPERPGRRDGADAPQHRRVVAVRGARRGRSAGDERLGLRRDRARVRPPPPPRSPVCGQGASHQRADARPERAAARYRTGVAGPRSPERRRAGFPPAVHAAARPAVARWRRDPSQAPRLRRAGGAERVAPVLRFGRNLLGAAPRDRHAASRPQARPSRRAAAAGGDFRQHRLHHPPAKRHRGAGAALGRDPGRGAGTWRRSGGRTQHVAV
ncbi:MAG: Glycolate dehydrogenase, iron-sulfur subunit GlcF, partial [uncultured Ramlibacter sp.]